MQAPTGRVRQFVQRVRSPGAKRDGTVLVTSREVNGWHEAGSVLQRLLGGVPDLLSVYTAENPTGRGLVGSRAARISAAGSPPAELYRRLLSLFSGSCIRRVVCVPAGPDELRVGLALKELCGAKLCVYVVGDGAHPLPEDLLGEALARADLRLATSPEMRDRLQSQFRLRVYLLPPMVPPEWIATKPAVPAPELLAGRRGVVVGPLRPAEFGRLALVAAAAGLAVDWYRGDPAGRSERTPASLQGLHVRSWLPDAALVPLLRHYPYVIVPSGSTAAGETDANRWHLPSLLPLLSAAGNLPAVVLSDGPTAASAFVERLGVGVVTSYDGEALRAAVEDVTSRQESLRAAAAAAAPAFSAAGAADGLFDALERGAPPVPELEGWSSQDPTEVSIYVPEPVPAEVFRDFAEIYRSMKRLRAGGYAPNFVADVGASTGIWSKTVRLVFPDARYLLFEPLYGEYVVRYPYLRTAAPVGEVVPVALGDRDGEVDFLALDNLYGSSALPPAGGHGARTVRVRMATLDGVATERGVRGRGVLKLDVQGAEHLVLAGAKAFIGQVDVLVVELSLAQLAEGALGFREMHDLIAGLGFTYHDDVGEWRDPADGTLLQKDCVFVRTERIAKIAQERA